MYELLNLPRPTEVTRTPSPPSSRPNTPPPPTHPLHPTPLTTHASLFPDCGNLMFCQVIELYHISLKLNTPMIHNTNAILVWSL